MKTKLALVTLAAAAAALFPALPLPAEEWPFPDGPVAVVPHVSDRAFWEAQRSTCSSSPPETVTVYRERMGGASSSRRASISS